MRVLISAEGNHEPAGQHYMVVDNHGFLVDLSRVTGTLHDPTILRSEWGPIVTPGGFVDAGVITRQDGGKQPFYGKDLLKPYLDAWKARKAVLENSPQ